MLRGKVGWLDNRGSVVLLSRYMSDAEPKGIEAHCPAQSSYIKQPRAQISDLTSYGCPLINSGDM